MTTASHSPVLAFSAWLLVGCGSTVPAAKPVTYPALPPSVGALELVPDVDIAPLALVCRPDELPQANGLDDDCDGHIDGPTGSAEPSRLSLALAYPVGTAIELVVRAEPGHAVAVPLQPPPPNQRAGESFSLQRFDLGTLEPGRYTLVLRQPAREPAGEGEVPVSIGLESAAGARSYLARVPPEQPLTLGTLDVR